MTRKLTSLFIAVAGILGNALSVNAATQTDYTLYNPQAWVIGVSGDTTPLLETAVSDRFVVNPVNTGYESPVPAGKKLSVAQIAEAEAALNKEDAGRKVLDWLLCYDAVSNTISDRKLMERAALNRRLAGLPPVSDAELKNNLTPLLTHNYIYLQKKIYFPAPSGTQIDSTRNYYTLYALFSIEASESALAKVIAQNDAPLYQSLPVTVKCVETGYAGTHSNISTLLSKHVPALAQSTVVATTHPSAQIAQGKDEGLNNGDLVSLFRTTTDKRGTPTSQRIGYARLVNVNNHSASFEPLTIGANHIDAEDVAVHRGNKNVSVKAGATWMKGMWGGELGVGFRISTNSHGYAWKVLIDGGYAASGSGEKSTDRFISNVNGNAGVGLSKTFGGFVELMPSVQIGYSYVHTSLGKSGSNSVNGNYLRFPIGLTAGFNVCYPLQIVLSAGYVPTVGFEFDGAQSPTENHKKVKDICKANNVCIDGFFMKLGLQINF